MSNLNPYEQYMLELINRARADPAAEAARLGIGLNDGLQPGQISTASKQPLAGNALLSNAAAAHSRDMLAFDYFDHTGRNGSDVGDRIEDAGYTDWRTWGENISYRGGGNVRAVEVLEGHHDGLFRSSGHRTNLMNNGFDEIGIGQEYGQYDGFSASMLTQNFASDGGDPFLLGVIFDDKDGDDFFDPGEELTGVRIAVAGEGATTSGAGGGYELRVDGSATLRVTFSGGELGQTVTRTITIGEENVKLDLNKDDLATIPTPPRPPISEPPSDPLTGTSGADVIVGSSGADRIATGDGNDRGLGGAGNDTLLGQGGNDRLYGGADADRLYGQDGFDFLAGGTGNDTLLGGAGNDRLYGNNGTDVLVGGGDRDVLFGGAGNDRMLGQGGTDYLTGGAGNDVMIGGSGRDVFRFAANSGRDVVKDFTDRQDKIVLIGDDDGLSDLQIRQYAGGKASISHDGGLIILLNVDVDTLGATDFVFA